MAATGQTKRHFDGTFGNASKEQTPGHFSLRGMRGR